MLAKIWSTTSGLASAAMWIWKSRWMAGRATGCATGAGETGVTASVLAGLLALGAEAASCFVLVFGFASLSVAASAPSSPRSSRTWRPSCAGVWSYRSY